MVQIFDAKPVSLHRKCKIIFQSKENKIMKFKNVIAIFFCFFTLTEKIFCTLTVSQYAPDSFFQKPYFNETLFTNISTIFSGGYADKAFNNQSQRVPFLQQFGDEDFLKKFINPSLHRSDISSMGIGKLSGNFEYRQLIVSCYKNIFNDIFIEAATVVQDLTVNSITADFVSSQAPLTPDQISYLTNLQAILPQSINRFGMFTTAFYIGYNKTFHHFTHLDFFDILFKTGFATPECMHENNNSILQFPFNENFNFGYPVIGAISIGLLDWMTLGWNGTVEPFQPATKNIRINHTNSDNKLLVPETSLAVIHRGPLFSTSAYIEADHIISGVSGTVGYAYTKNLAYTIRPLNQTQYPMMQANQSTLFDAWSMGSMYFEFNVDFATDYKPSAPIISIFCAIPIVGELCPKTDIFGGSCNVQISYIF